MLPELKILTWRLEESFKNLQTHTKESYCEIPEHWGQIEDSKNLKRGKNQVIHKNIKNHNGFRFINNNSGGKKTKE